MPENRILRIILLVIIFVITLVIGFFGGMLLARLFSSHLLALCFILLSAAIGVSVYTIEKFVYGEE